MEKGEWVSVRRECGVGGFMELGKGGGSWGVG